MTAFIKITAAFLMAGVMLAAGRPVPAEGEAVQFYQEKKTGWWWYQDPGLEKKPSDNEKMDLKPVRVIPSIASIPDEILWNLHPDQFQEILLSLQKQAVQNPTERAIGDYTRMLDMARRKSVVFANASMLYIQQHPEYDIAAADPTATPGRIAMANQTKEDTENKITWAAGHYGLVYLYSTECRYCEAQTPILKFFSEKYSWDIEPYEITKNRKVADTFNVTVTPTLLIVGRKKGEYLIVSSGVVSLPDLEERIYRGVRLLEGETTVGSYTTYEHQDGTVKDPQSLFKK